MEITTSTPTDTIGIAEQVVKVHTPYKEGHTCTENEAASLNQTRKENIRNNQREPVQKLLKEGKNLAEISKVVLDYSKTYEFGQVGGGGHAANPTERRALLIIKGIIEDGLRKKGVKLDTVSAKDMSAKCRTVLDQNPQVMETAKAQIEAEGKVTIKGLDTGQAQARA